jgi:hypothetical protein
MRTTLRSPDFGKQAEARRICGALRPDGDVERRPLRKARGLAESGLTHEKN